MTEPVDVQARREALDPGRSFIVQAPAGSGKTELLVRRFLRLLTTVEAPEQILAITFTRKATAEMRQRILRALQGLNSEGEAEDDPEMLALAREARMHDESHDWNLAGNPSRLRVQTIDSFCYELVRRMPWSARFGTVPPPVEDPSRLYQEAADRTLAMIEDEGEPEIHDALVHLLDIVDANRGQAERMLAGMLAGRDRWLSVLGALTREDLEENWQDTIADTLEACDGFLDSTWKENLSGLIQFAARESVDEKNNVSDSLRQLLDSWREDRKFPEPVPEEVKRWKAVAGLLLTNDGNARKQIDRRMGFPASAKDQKASLRKLLGKLAGMPELVKNLVLIRSLPSPWISDEEWEITRLMPTLLPVLAAQLRLLFSSRHQADFTEIAHRANWALGRSDEPTDLTLVLDYQLRHILMDEFQDTSSGQLELLERLIAGWEPEDGRTLFLVGDPMQSIYRFREAEVGNFLAVQSRGIGDMKPDNLSLKSNFRSSPELVNWFNRCFSQVMPDRRSITYGAVKYTSAHSHLPPDSKAGVEVHPGVRRTTLQEAKDIASLIADTLGRHSGDVAVLGRSRSHLTPIMQELKERMIPFQRVRLERLSERQAIQDLMALTLVLTQSADRTAWLGVLRAPWGGATFHDLIRLTGEGGEIPVLSALRDDIRLSGLEPDTRSRLCRIRDVMEDALERMGRIPLHRNLEACWLCLGGPAVVGPSDIENCRQYLRLIRDLEKERIPIHAQSLSAALDTLHAEHSVEERVKLTTIHSAKGLEYDTVILPGLHLTTRGDMGEIIRWKKLPGRLLIAPKFHKQSQSEYYEYLGILEKEHQLHELGRLLYVACTRARRRLHLFGSIDPGRTPASTSMLNLLWDTVVSDFRASEGKGRGAEVDQPDPDSQVGPIPSLPVLYQLDPDWKLPDLPLSVLEGLSSQEETWEEDRIEYDWAQETTRILGISIHRALQDVDRTGWEVWKNHPFTSDDRSIWCRWLLDAGLSPNVLEEAVQRMKEALVMVQKDPIADWIFSARHSDIRTEWALTGMDRHDVTHHVILDRSFIDVDGTRWIIDFKSSRHDDRYTLESFLSQEKKRYQEVMSRYGQIVHALEGKPVQTALYYPLLGRMVEYGSGGGD